jgi:hypothetical protein
MLRLVDRREWLRLGILAGAAGFAGRLPAESPNPQHTRKRAVKPKSVLIVFASGGQSQIDTWDPKPSAPTEIRGLFKSIPTRTPGVRLCEHMPKLAALSHRYAIIRSMSHDDLDHGSACYAALTGHFHPRKSSNPIPKPTDFPTLGAIVRRVRPRGPLPYTAAHLNGPMIAPELVSAGQYGGFLGRAYEPLQIGDVRESATELAGLDPREDLPAVRLDRRRTLLENIDRYRKTLAEDPALMDMSIRRRQAYELLAVPQTRTAFDLTREPRSIRERYGLHRAGQSCLLARRLIEAGVPYVVTFFPTSIRGQDKDPDDGDAYGWDTHNDVFEALKEHLLPRFDATFSVLLQDLEQRGLLESTLVLCMGEFGRAPLVALEKTFAGSSPGRKHWAAVYSIVAAGGGVRGGKVLGSSDKIGAYPASPSWSPADVSATIFDALGIDPEGFYRDALDRPVRVSEGRVLRPLYEG